MTRGTVRTDPRVDLENIISFRLFDDTGRLILKCEPVRTLDLSNLENDIYFLVATGNQNTTHSAKIIVLR